MFECNGAVKRIGVIGLNDGRITFTFTTNYSESTKHITQLVLGLNYLRLDYNNGEMLGVTLTTSGWS